MSEGFDFLWYQEFKDKNNNLSTTFGPFLTNGRGAILENIENISKLNFSTLPWSILLGILFYILLRTAISGGILNTFNQKKHTFSYRKFFNGAGHFFIRFLKIMCISFIWFTFLAFIINPNLKFFIQNIESEAYSEIPGFYMKLFQSAIILALLIFAQIVFDYARIKVVKENKYNVLKTVWSSFLFVLKHPLSTIGLYAILVFITAALTILLLFLNDLAGQLTSYGIILAIITQQILIFVFITFRIHLYASEIFLYRSKLKSHV